jgi:hypothetical protein
MAFTDLNLETQNLISLQFEFLGKAVLILILVAFCFFYIHGFKQKEKSAYKFTKMFKGLLYVISWTILIFSPLFVNFLAPKVSFSDVLQFFIVGYSIFILITGIIISFNVIFYGTHFLMDFFGLDSKTKEGKKEFKRIFGKGGMLD